jgi:hypothetical protein
MDDEAFEGFIKSHAAQMETETLQRVTEHIREVIAQRLTGKPSWLKRGSRIHALDLKLDWNKYGEVTRISGKSCFIMPAASEYEERIVFSRHAIRLVDDIEWNNIVWHFADRKAEYQSKRVAEIEELHREREEAIKNRDNPKRKLARVARSAGQEIVLFIGAYVHAHDDGGVGHTYGVVVGFTSKSCTLSSPVSEFTERIVYDKHDLIEVLDNGEWAAVEAELKRREAEIADARASGKKSLACMLETRYEGAEASVS